MTVENLSTVIDQNQNKQKSLLLILAICYQISRYYVHPIRAKLEGFL